MPRVDVDGALAFLEAFVATEAPGFEARADLADVARATSVAYTETRAIPLHAAADVAYLAHFGPRAVVAVARAASALPAEVSLDHVVDIGAGSGASALAWAFAGARRLTLVDRSSAALLAATRLLAGVPVEVHTRQADVVTATPVDGATVLSAAFVVGELGAEVDVAAWIRRLANGASVVVVDAGDRPRARRLQSLRDALIGNDDVAVFGPCPHQDPCPALVRERDWCHDRVDKGLPPRLAAFARRVGRDDAAMSLSWLCFGPGAPRARDGVVVIGEPRREKGRARLPVCGPAGLRFVQVLQRDKTLFRRALDVERGARLPSPTDVGAVVVGDTWSIGADASDVVFGLVDTAEGSER
jgi:ribosomal protein RSM22 (predicted rRNA methylase)